MAASTLPRRLEATRFRRMTLWSAVLIVGGFVTLAYGSLDLFTPTTTTRWQVRSTAKAGGSRKAVGERFQRWIKMDPQDEPWKDSRVLRRVRLIGAVLALTGAVLIGLGAALWS